MLGKERKLMVDDLIVEYMILKVQFGYKPSYTPDEFISFLRYFEQYMEVQDTLYDCDQLFDRFFERKRDDWSVSVGSKFIGGYKIGEEKIFVPHIERRGEILFATNKLSDYDYGNLNIKFMSKREQDNVRNIIIDFLNKLSKNDININSFVSHDERMVGEVVAALFVSSIWSEYVKDKIKDYQWPQQCRNIDDYLLNVDLAKIIKLPSIRDDLLSFYSDVSKRIAVLLHNDSKLEISNCVNPYLPYSNYVKIMVGYNHLLEICKNCFYGVSISDNAFIVNDDKTNKYSDSVITKLDDVDTKKLVRKLNKCIDEK